MTGPGRPGPAPAPDRVERQRARQRKWRQSPKGKAWQARQNANRRKDRALLKAARDDVLRRAGLR